MHLHIFEGPGGEKFLFFTGIFFFIVLQVGTFYVVSDLLERCVQNQCFVYCWHM